MLNILNFLLLVIFNFATQLLNQILLSTSLNLTNREAFHANHSQDTYC